MEEEEEEEEEEGGEKMEEGRVCLCGMEEKKVIYECVGLRGIKNIEKKEEEKEEEEEIIVGGEEGEEV